MNEDIEEINGGICYGQDEQQADYIKNCQRKGKVVSYQARLLFI